MEGGNGRRVRTDALTIASQAVPDLGGADDVDWGWVTRGVDVESFDAEEVGMSGF